MRVTTPLLVTTDWCSSGRPLVLYTTRFHSICELGPRIILEQVTSSDRINCQEFNVDLSCPMFPYQLPSKHAVACSQGDDGSRKFHALTFGLLPDTTTALDVL